MKKLIFALLALLPLAGNAENYFCEGTEWITRGNPWYWLEDGEKIDERYSIKGTCTLGEYECVKLWHEELNNVDSKILVSPLRVEGDKVFFPLDKAGENWMLLYDFGLEEGEGCYVGELNEYVSWESRGDDWDCQKAYVKHMWFDVANSISRPGMCIAVYDSEAEALANVTTHNHGTWVRGIGGEWGPLNNTKLSGYGGAQPSYLRIASNDEELYRHPDYMNPEYTDGDPAAIDGVAAGEKPGVAISGRELTVSGLEPGALVTVTAIDGRTVATRRATDGTARLTLPAAGHFIVSAPGLTRKVAATAAR